MKDFHHKMDLKMTLMLYYSLLILNKFLNKKIINNLPYSVIRNVDQYLVVHMVRNINTVKYIVIVIGQQMRKIMIYISIKIYYTAIYRYHTTYNIRIEFRNSQRQMKAPSLSMRFGKSNLMYDIIKLNSKQNIFQII